MPDRKVDRALAREVWPQADQGTPSKTIKVSTAVSRRTIQRLCTAKRVFENGGLLGSLATRNKWSSELIKEVKRWFDEYQASKPKPPPSANASAASADANKWFREQHLYRIREMVDLLRSCTFDARRAVFYNQGYLVLQALDWGFLPQEWVRVTTPYLYDEYDEQDEARKLAEMGRDVDWGPAYPLMREHLSSSPLWGYLKELRQMAEELDRDQQGAASKLQEQDQQFARAWEKLQRGRDLLHIRRTPELPQPDWDSLRIPYDIDLYWMAYRALEGLMPNLSDRHDALLKKLWQINGELEPDVVERHLIRGTCNQCKDMQQ